MHRKLVIAMFSLFILLGAQYTLAKSTSPQNASAYIVWPHEGAQVSSPFTVVFGLRNMGVAPADVVKENTGHFHLIIDEPTPAKSKAIPKGPHFRHFGGGKTEAILRLPKGRHTLQLMMGDHEHMPHEPPVTSRMITITVTE